MRITHEEDVQGYRRLTVDVLDEHNDYIQVYTKDGYLTDGGEALNGIYGERPTREAIQIAESHGLTVRDGDLVLAYDERDFELKLHQMVYTLVKISKIKE